MNELRTWQRLQKSQSILLDGNGKDLAIINKWINIAEWNKFCFQWILFEGIDSVCGCWWRPFKATTYLPKVLLRTVMQIVEIEQKDLDTNYTPPWFLRGFSINSMSCVVYIKKRCLVVLGPFTLTGFRVQVYRWDFFVFVCYW